MSGVQLVLARLTEFDRKPKKSGSGWKALCPAHDDKNPSLSIAESNDGKALIKCQVGCETPDVVAKLGLTMADLAAPGQNDSRAPLARNAPKGRQSPNAAPSSQNGDAPGTKPKRIFDSADSADEFLGRTPDGRPHQWWPYHDLGGVEVGRALRWNKPDGSKDYKALARVEGGWSFSGMPKPRPLYRLPEVAAATGTILVVEGEKCADALRSLGFTATTSFGGAKGAGQTDWTRLAGRDVVILPDNDESGRSYAQHVCALLAALVPPAQVRVLELPGLGDGGDVFDYRDDLRAAGQSDEAVRASVLDLIASAQPGDAYMAIARLDAPAPELEVEPDSEPWGHPVELSAPPPSSFPMEVLPARLRELVEAITVALQVPRDMVAICTLGCIAACVAKRKKVRVSADWTEALTAYFMVAMQPSERKSGVFSMLTRPIFAWQQKKAQEMAPQIRDAKERYDLLNSQVKSLQQRLPKAKKLERDGIEAELRDAKNELYGLKIPVAPRIRVDDITPEELGRVMAQNGGKIAVISSEGGFFDTIAGRYADGVPNIDLMLKAWDGSEAWDRDRVGDVHLSIREPILTMLFLIQPDVLKALGQKQGFKGRGVLARVLYCVPKSKVGTRDVNPPPVPQGVRDWWNGVITRLLDEEVNLDESGEIIAEEIEMEGPARQELLKFSAGLEPRLGDSGDLAYMAGWAGKLVGTVARLAGILQQVEPGGRSNGRVSLSTTARAIALGRYLLEHAMVAFDAMDQDPALERARAISKWICKQGALEFTSRDALDALRRELRYMENVEQGLAVLEERGHVRKKKTADKGGPGRRPSPIWEVNPAVFTPRKSSAESAEMPASGVTYPAGEDSADSADTFEGGRGADEEQVELLAEVPCEEAEKADSAEGADSPPQALTDSAAVGAPWRRSLEGLPYQPLYGGWRLIEIPRNWNAPEGADAVESEGAGPRQPAPSSPLDEAPGDPESPLLSDAGASAEGDEWQR